MTRRSCVRLEIIAYITFRSPTVMRDGSTAYTLMNISCDIITRIPPKELPLLLSRPFIKAIKTGKEESREKEKSTVDRRIIYSGKSANEGALFWIIAILPPSVRFAGKP